MKKLSGAGPSPLQRRLVGALIAATLAAGPAHAFSTGIVGVSGRDGPICNSCHSGGSAQTVSLEGPQEVSAGDLVTYRFSVQSQSAKQIAAGLNVAANGGQLTATDPGTQIIAGQLTHRSPRRNDAQGLAQFDFDWTAPQQPGTYTMFAAGNSVNLNRASSGDRAAATTLDITVTAAAPTPPPSATFTATATPSLPPSATAAPTSVPTATIPPTLSPTLPPQPCVGDCNGDGRVDVTELVTGVRIALGAPASDACSTLDADGDTRISIDELVAAVAASLAGCG
jgi:hypothetical protein